MPSLLTGLETVYHHHLVQICTITSSLSVQPVLLNISDVFHLKKLDSCTYLAILNRPRSCTTRDKLELKTKYLNFNTCRSKLTFFVATYTYY